MLPLLVMLYSILGVCFHKSSVLLLCLSRIFCYRKILHGGLHCRDIAKSSPWCWNFWHELCCDVEKKINLLFCPQFRARDNNIIRIHTIILLHCHYCCFCSIIMCTVLYLVLYFPYPATRRHSRSIVAASQRRRRRRRRRRQEQQGLQQEQQGLQHQQQWPQHLCGFSSTTSMKERRNST